MELMVVVVLIAILAMLASPSFQAARNEKLLFDYARTFQELIFKARARAAGTGAAHLVIVAPGPNLRGYVRVYEALDNTTTAGPNPVSSCKGLGQWTDAYAYPAVTPSNRARFVDWVDLNGTGVNQEVNLHTILAVNGAEVGALAICITPSGNTYIASGSAVSNAGDLLRDTTPFTGIAEITLIRGGTIATAIGLKRRIILTGSAAPRLKTDE